MKLLSFSDSEKIKAFDRLSGCFLNHNFGTVGKSDIELIFFSVVMEHLKSNNLRTDDYTVSNILGITQQRVRNLKIKDQLRNQYDYDWKSELASLAQNPHYSPDDRTITISLDNPVLFIEVQHFIEQQNGIIDYSLNPKLLRMQTRDFALLMVEIGISTNKKQVLKSIRKEYQRENGIDEQLTREKLTTRLLNGSLDFAKDIISNVVVGMLTSK